MFVSHRHTKKAGLLVAVLISHSLERLFLRIFRFTRLWYCPFIPNKQHRSPRRICIRTRVPIKYTRQESHILRTSIAAMPWNKIEFTRFRKAKNKVRMTPFFYKMPKAMTGVFGQTCWLSERRHFPPPKPRRWTFDCKDTTFF